MSGLPTEQAKAEATSPLGLYVHIPFCARRCPYCDFAIMVGAEPDDYRHRMLANLAAFAFTVALTAIGIWLALSDGFGLSLYIDQTLALSWGQRKARSLSRRDSEAVHQEKGDHGVSTHCT